MVGMPSIVTEEEVSESYIQKSSLTVTGLLPGSPAVLAGLKIGDELVSLTARDEDTVYIIPKSSEILTPTSVSDFISRAGIYDNGMDISYLRDGEEYEVNVLPVLGVIEGETDRFAIGIAMDLVGVIKYNPIQALWEGVKFTINSFIMITVGIVGFFASALTMSADLSTVAGPVGIVGLVGDASALGFIFLLNFTAFISINLAIINLLPFPALDGGRLFFLLIEWIKGSPINPVVANTLNLIGFGLLILLMLVITYSDIARIVSAG